METARSAEWTKDHIQALLDAMKSSIPSRESEKMWSVGLKTLDWNKVAFEPFSAEECCAKWQEIMQKLRKVKSLTELIVDAQDVILNQVSIKRINPKVSKKPVSANALFVGENMEQFKKKHPKMNSRELMKYANKEYKKLPANDKEKYLMKVQKTKEEYKAHSNTIFYNSKEGDTETQLVPPPKPPLTGYNLFCSEQKSQMNGVPHDEITTVWSQRWKKLTEEAKAEYSWRCYEMKEEYNAKLNKFLSGLNKKKQEWILQKYGLKEICLKKRPVKDQKTFPGEPKMPNRNPRSLFFKNNLTKTKVASANEHPFSQASEKFKKLSPKTKQGYYAKVNKNLHMYAVELQKWFETLTAAEQQKYCEHNPSKLKYLRCKSGLRTLHHRTSDSEDEDLEDSSSSDSDEVIVIEPEEEDEEVIMFELF